MYNDPANHRINNASYPSSPGSGDDLTLPGSSPSNPYYTLPSDASIPPPPPIDTQYGATNPYTGRGSAPSYSEISTYPVYNQPGPVPPYYQPGMVPPPAGAPPAKRSAGRKGFLVLASVLALLVIAGSVITFAALSAARRPGASSPVSVQDTATAPAQAQASATAPVQAQATATASAQSIATAHTQATATASAQAQASAAAHAQATATAVVSSYPFSTALQMSDSLATNNHKYGWDTTSFCIFKNGTYHVLGGQKGTMTPCFANSTNFSDFTYQVSMTLVQGGGGLVFRGDAAKGTYYTVECYSNGSYYLKAYPAGTGPPKTLLHGTMSNQFHTGFGQSNDIGIVARGSSIAFYVNGVQVMSVTDNAYNVGQIGVLVASDTGNAEVEYSNARAWKL